MDRRQQKTRRAIFAAFSTLLQKKRFDQITVQEIIDEANIGRSTFYAHFETRDHLLKAMCTDIFEHVSNRPLPEETEGENNLELKLGHILFHLREQRDDLKGILTGGGAEVFLRFFGEYLSALFESCKEAFSPEIPQDFLLSHLTGSFCEAVRWWMARGAEPEPEQVAAYFMALVKSK